MPRPVTHRMLERSSTFDRNDHFAQFVAWYMAGRLTPEQIGEHLLEAWVGAEWPRGIAEDAGLDTHGIVGMFRAAGFLCDAPAVAPPSRPMHLYRGCSESGAAGFSWTTSLETARWFAKREARFAVAGVRDPEDDGSPVIIAAMIDPAHILATVTEGRSEAEVIIDPIGARDAIFGGRYSTDLDIDILPAFPERQRGGAS